jgi:hypothetical protein
MPQGCPESAFFHKEGNFQVVMANFPWNHPRGSLGTVYGHTAINGAHIAQSPATATDITFAGAAVVAQDIQVAGFPVGPRNPASGIRFKLYGEFFQHHGRGASEFNVFMIDYPRRGGGASAECAMMEAQCQEVHGEKE